jgi:hypothetical protein
MKHCNACMISALNRGLGVLTIVALTALALVSPEHGAGQAPARAATQTQVWFHPNLGSEDLLRLFSEPDSWPRVRERINVFGFGFASLRDPNNAAIQKFGPGNNWLAIQRADAVRKLSDWGKLIDVTAQSIQFYKEPPAPLENARRQAKLTLEAIDNVFAAGGRVQYISMDSPLHFSERNRYSRQDAVQAVASYIDAVRARYPEIQVGEYSSYPSFSVAEIERWVDALTAAGARPAFEHLDINYQLLLQPRQTAGRARFAADLPALAAFYRQRHIPWGPVFTTTTGVVTSSRQFFTETRQSIQLEQSVLRALPEHVVFQSWADDSAGRKTYPANLPETGNFSLTYLVKSVMGL